jgi:hypothetical protein
MLHIPVPVPEIRHPVIDDRVAAGAPEQGPDGKAMHHAGGVVDLADRIALLDHLPGGVEVEKSSGRIDDPALVECEEIGSLLGKPLPMERTDLPTRAEGRE